MTAALATHLPLCRDYGILLSSATVREAAEVMAETAFGTVLIIDAHQQFLGLFSEEDLSRKVIAEGLDPEITAVGEVMLREPPMIHVSMTREEALELMAQCGFRALPVVDGAQIAGLLCLGGLVQAENLRPPVRA